MECLKSTSLVGVALTLPTQRNLSSGFKSTVTWLLYVNYWAAFCRIEKNNVTVILSHRHPSSSIKNQCLCSSPMAPSITKQFSFYFADISDASDGLHGRVYRHWSFVGDFDAIKLFGLNPSSILTSNTFVGRLIVLVSNFQISCPILTRIGTSLVTGNGFWA